MAEKFGIQFILLRVRQVLLLRLLCLFWQTWAAPGDQSWETVSGGNVIAGLTTPGNYKIAVYVTDYGDATGGCTQDPFHTQNNGGAYFVSNFSFCGNLAAPLAGTYSVGANRLFSYDCFGSNCFEHVWY